MCLQCLHFAITRHLIVGSAHEQLPHRCASCKISASSRANTGSVQHTAARSCMVPSAFLQPCTFCKSRLLRPNVRNSHRPLMTMGDVPLTGTRHQQQIMRCLTLCSTIVGHASSDYCYIPALRPSGGAHPIGVWAHTRETTMVGCQSRSSGSAYQQSTSRKPKCYCRLGGGLPRAVRNVEARRHSRRSVPFSIVSIVRHVCDTIRLELPIGRRM